MGLKGKLTAEVEVSSHGHHLHDYVAKKPHDVSKISPHFQGCELHEGEFGKPGSIVCWSYTLDGRACVLKEVIEEMDDVKKTITLKVIEGQILEDYSSLVTHLHATEKEVKYVIEYEKLKDDGPHPTKLLDMILDATRHIDEHHLQA